MGAASEGGYASQDKCLVFNNNISISMKRLFLISYVLLLGVCQVAAQKRVEFKESQARLLEPQQSAYVKPLIVDLKVDASQGRIHHVVTFSNAQVEALKNDISNMRSNALFQTTEKFNADVIVGATFDVQSIPDGSGYTVTVIGYPARYDNWRSVAPEDYGWIHMGAIQSESDKIKAVVR